MSPLDTRTATSPSQSWKTTSPSYRPIGLQSVSTFSSSTTVHHLPGSAAWQSLHPTTEAASSISQCFPPIFFSYYHPHELHPQQSSHSWEKPGEFFSSSLSSSKCTCTLLYPCLETLHWIEISLSVDFHPLVCEISSQLLNLLISHGSSPNTGR